jgi:hypothetical protein
MNPWDRLEEESSHAYSAFLVYRDLPKRSIRRTQSAITAFAVSKTVVGAWARRYNWLNRARAWDNHLTQKTERKVVRSLLREQSRLTLKRIVARSLAVSQAIKTLEQINRTTLSCSDPSELLELLRATRQAFELVGLSQLDFDEQLHRFSAAGGKNPQVVRSDPDPEELLGLQDESDKIQLGNPAAETILD